MSGSPQTLLPFHFRVKADENLSQKITTLLKDYYALKFTEFNVSWRGSVLRASSRMEFVISLYREDAETYIVELQRVDGSGALFGELYQYLERNIKNQSYIHREFDGLESTEEEILYYVNRAISMITYHDPAISLDGVHSAGEIIIDKNMLWRVWDTELLTLLISVVEKDDNLHKREHAMFSIAHAARNNIEEFRKLSFVKLGELLNEESPHIAFFAKEITQL